MRPTLNQETLYTVFQSLFNYNHDACYALDAEGNFLLFNDEAECITGYSKEEALQMEFAPLVKPNLLIQTYSFFKRVLNGSRERFETTILHKDGHEIQLAIVALPFYIDQEIKGIVGMAKDITKTKKIERWLNGQNRVLEMVAKGLPFTKVLNNIIHLMEGAIGGICSVYLLDEDGVSLRKGASPHVPSQIVRISDGSKIGPLVAPSGTAAFLNEPVVISDITADYVRGQYVDILLGQNIKACWSYPVSDNNQTVLGVFTVYHETVSSPSRDDLEFLEKATHLTSLAIQHYRSEEKINNMAYHDTLTGLPNRRYFMNHAKLAIDSYETSSPLKIGIMYLDLDRFKIINDSLGHNIGDLLLIEVANRLMECVGREDVPSRQGGDEFTILLKQTSEEEAAGIAQRILDKLSAPFCIEGQELFVTPSIGVSLFPHDGSTLDVLLRKADIAMYQAKKKGRNNFQFYNSNLDKRAHERLTIENEMRRALIREEFYLLYQPIVDLSRNDLVSVEALIRWNNPRLGNISPSDFIPIAEETGMIIPIGEWVLKEACRQLKRFKNEGLPLKSVTVNLSLRQFYQPNLVQRLSQIINEAEINPNCLTLEITESMTMDVDTAIKTLRSLKGLGVNIAIDDFGTGYSSLSHLKSFPIDYLKVDQSFIRDIELNEEGKNIVITILQMANNLGIKAVAEGVETAEQLKFLRRHQCHKAQGYLLSKPITAKNLIQIMDDKTFLKVLA